MRCNFSFLLPNKQRSAIDNKHKTSYDKQWMDCRGFRQAATIAVFIVYAIGGRIGIPIFAALFCPICIITVTIAVLLQVTNMATTFVFFLINIESGFI